LKSFDLGGNCTFPEEEAASALLVLSALLPLPMLSPVQCQTKGRRLDGRFAAT